MQKHERITIVILAYLIGFTTAYIAFNFYAPPTQNIEFASQENFPMTDNTASVSQTVSKADKKSVSVEEKIDGFYAIIDGKERIMSAQAISATSANPGFHHQLFAVEVSPNAQFIHYCAQSLSTDSFCSHYVFNVVEDTTHKVNTSEGKQLTSSLSNIEVSWSPDSTLVGAMWQSVSQENPWVLQEVSL